MTQASKNAYCDPDNKIKRKSHKDQIKDHFMWNHNALFLGNTALAVARILQLPTSSCIKRCSDLHREGRLKVIGIKDGHSVYIDDNVDRKMTKTEAYLTAIKAYCDADQISSIIKFVNNNTL